MYLGLLCVVECSRGVAGTHKKRRFDHLSVLVDRDLGVDRKSRGVNVYAADIGSVEGVNGGTDVRGHRGSHRINHDLAEAARRIASRSPYCRCTARTFGLVGSSTQSSRRITVSGRIILPYSDYL